jgi:sugar/nucleoside kinase (ribokinase family)
VIEVARPLVVGLGRVGVSLTGIAPALPDTGPDGGVVDLAAVSFSVSPGVGIAAATASALGCSARVAGTIAADALGRFARAQLAEAGIDCGELRPWGAVSPCRVTAVDRGGHRLVLEHEGIEESEQPPPTLDPAATLGGASALLCDGTWLDAQIAAARMARARQIPVIVDLGEVTASTGELVSLADIVIASERVATELAPRSELPDALAELRDLGPRVVIVTLGAAGSIGLHGQTLVECPAFPVDVVDATGAGAVFHGAFSAALLSDLPLARCMELAGAAAALSCQALGPWDGIPRRDEVLSLVRART